MEEGAPHAPTIGDAYAVAKRTAPVLIPYEPVYPIAHRGRRYVGDIALYMVIFLKPLPPSYPGEDARKGKLSPFYLL